MELVFRSTPSERHLTCYMLKPEHKIQIFTPSERFHKFHPRQQRAPSWSLPVRNIQTQTLHFRSSVSDLPQRRGGGGVRECVAMVTVSDKILPQNPKKWIQAQHPAPTPAGGGGRECVAMVTVSDKILPQNPKKWIQAQHPAPTPAGGGGVVNALRW